MPYKNIWGLLFLLLLLPSTSSFAFEGIEHTYAALLVSGQSKKAKIAAESLFEKESNNIELLDIIAELLYRGSKTELDFSSDDLAWLAKSLGRSRLSRYRQTLQQADENIAILEANYKPVKKEVDDDDAEEEVYGSFWETGPAWDKAVHKIPYEIDHKKVRSYIADALKRLSKQASEQFIAGELDFEALNEKIETIRKANFKDRNLIEFKSIKRGTSIYDIYDKIGLPDHEGYHFVNKARLFAGNIIIPQLQISYKQHGTIQFIYKGMENGRNAWNVYRVIPTTKISGPVPEGVINKLKSEDPYYIRKAAQKMYKEDKFDEQTLDLAAQIIWNNRNTEESIMTDAIAWLCRVVGKSKNSRYRTLISEVAKTTENSKIEKFAEKQLDLFEDEGVPQFLAYSKSSSE